MSNKIKDKIKKAKKEEIALEVKNACPVPYAVKVTGVSKSFRVPHRKIDSLRNFFVNLFAPNRYENFEALKDVSFEVKKGEFFGIIGRNGAGKSTLLKILASVYKPTSGSIKINGMISPFLELGIGFNPELSGRDNIYLNATVLGLTKKEIDKKFDEIVAFAELEEFIDQQIKNYSSGMQARLAFSVSIHANRDILLMDEVLAVGDTAFQHKCLNIFKNYKKKGRTVILVTHSMTTVREYCDRALLLADSKILDIGDVDEVLNKYILLDMEKGEHSSNKNVKEDKNKQVAEIIKINILSKDGDPKNSFESGEDISVRVYFKINKEKPVFNFGISIFSIDKNYIFGTNTIFDKVNVEEILNKGYFQIDIKDVRLARGLYYVSTVIAGSDFGNLYSKVEKSNKFSIFTDKDFEGTLYLKHSWED
jgi:ABC-type polysaccharide/polyol phosphate transport system ATPase subunit